MTTFPLRDPKAFLESMLRLLNSEAEAAVAIPARGGSSDGTTKEALMMALTSSTGAYFLPLHFTRILLTI